MIQFPIYFAYRMIFVNKWSEIQTKKRGEIITLNFNEIASCHEVIVNRMRPSQLTESRSS